MSTLVSRSICMMVCKLDHLELWRLLASAISLLVFLNIQLLSFGCHLELCKLPMIYVLDLGVISQPVIFSSENASVTSRLKLSPPNSVSYEILFFVRLKSIKYQSHFDKLRRPPDANKYLSYLFDDFCISSLITSGDFIFFL